MAKKKHPRRERIVKVPIERVPQRLDVWQAEFRANPGWVRIAGRLVRPWIVMMTSRSADLILAQQLVDERPSADRLWDILTTAIRNPGVGQPHRPTELQARPDARWDVLQPRLDEIAVTVVRTEELDQVDAVLSWVNQ